MKIKNNMVAGVLLLFMILICNIAVGNKREEGLDQPCPITVSTIYLKKATIKDSSICLMLDSALTFIKKQQSSEVPYRISLVTNAKGLPVGNLEVQLLASENYSLLDDENFQTNIFLVQYNGYKITLSTHFSEPEKKFFNFTTDIAPYTVYLTQTVDMICFNETNVNQEVLFELVSCKNLFKFIFRHYRYSILTLPLGDDCW